MDQNLLLQDAAKTCRNREALFKKKNLLYWYERLYAMLLGAPEAAARSRVLEIGSGMSPLKRFYPSVLTSDILPLDYVDHTFDAHDIDRISGIEDESLDILTMTNVLHHLKDPVRFLLRARKKLKKQGRILLVEPYFSAVSGFVYKYLHFEPTDFGVSEPCLSDVASPLSSANIALPHMIFFGKKGWEAPLLDYYAIDRSKSFFYTGLSYMITGGISRNILIPHCFYKILWYIDQQLAEKLPSLCASFFFLTLIRKN